MKAWLYPIFGLFVLVSKGLWATDERVIFHSIPQSQTASIVAMLDERFSREQIFPGNSFQQVKNLKTLKRFSLFHGDFFYYQLKKLQAKRIAFLQDPIAYVLNEHRAWTLTPRNTEDPIETINNPQCRLLSSFRALRSIPIRDHLRSAQRNLKKFFFVGIYEDLEQSLQSLFILLGWRPPAFSPQTTTEEKSGEVSQEVRTALRKRNWADIRLYQYAKKLYAKKLRTMQKSLVIKKGLPNGQSNHSSKST